MEETRRIVLLGKTGSGKSNLGNTILGENKFQVDSTSKSGTKTCEDFTKEVFGRKVKVIDTPGVFDTDPESSDLSPELLECIKKCLPGPHAFLLVLKVEKFTKQEQAAVDLIRQYFSEEALKYTTVVFTHGDQLDEGVTIKKWVKDNAALSELIQKCGGRCHVVDNKYWNNSQDQYRNNQHQVRELLETIDQTVKKNRGTYYTNDLLKKAAADDSFLGKLKRLYLTILLSIFLGKPGTMLESDIFVNASRPALATDADREYEAAEQAETPKEGTMMNLLHESI